MIGVIVAFFFVALALVAQNISYTAQENKVRDLITRKTNLDMDIAPYIIQENTLVKLSGVEDYARSSLNMDFPNEERVVLGIIVLALVIINLINIGSYRSEIEKIAADSGVKLKLEGDISHSVMHRISLELDDVVIYESTQDGAPEFVRVKKLRVSISPFALLTSKTVHINRAVLTDTTVTNRIYADGSSTISRFTGGLPKSPPPPPNPNPIDIFAYNLQADELNIENIAFRNINLPRKQEFTASGVTLRASDVNLDRNSVLRLSFNTQITNNGKPELIFDAVLSTQFRLNRTERIFTAENFTFDGELTYKGFDRQKINLNIPAAEFNINALALKPTQAGFSIGDMLSGTLYAEGTFKNDTAAKFKLQTDIPDAKPLLQKATGKAYKSRTPLPLLLGVEGSFAKQTLSVKFVSLESGSTSVRIQPISFNVQDKTYRASLNITSRNLKQILDSVDMNLLRDNIRIDLKSDFKGDIEHGQHKATLNGSADELNLRLDASSKGTDNKNLALALGMEVVSPDVVKLLKKVSADVGYPAKIPLKTTLKTEVQLTDDQVNLNQFRFELNDNFFDYRIR
ncbi:hypothetical protein CHS0354_006824 [Potamilus streckersoni]|uniref:AsmA domain-containing protein n=1 Tax=Potamilus streckersoni TaxID=2493646 RepID=A0AAE0TFJ5_9BIVA|nr:hypothetical protein CHS0354_006824 [Potamilus streckersoni]